MANIMGYETQTTFYEDFSIADVFGIDAVKDTYERAFNEWKTNTVFVTELCMVMNWKIWQWYGKNDKLAKVYDELWNTCALWCEKNLKDDDLAYYYRTTD